MKSIPARKPAKRGGVLGNWYLTCGAVAVFLFIAFLYIQVFMGLRKVAHPLGDDQHSLLNPLEAPTLIREAANAVSDKFRSMRGERAADTSKPAEDDDDLGELDLINERGHFPEMKPSHYGLVHGAEPWERPNLKVWDLHTIPSDEWYERAKKATDRCDLELTHKTTGAENGLDDKVVWVTALFDLKRGEAAMGDFQRGMDEYYQRFQRVLDRGFQMVIYIPTDFEAHLKVDHSRVKIIYMNATDLKWYFPYYERLQQVR